MSQHSSKPLKPSKRQKASPAGFVDIALLDESVPMLLSAEPVIRRSLSEVEADIQRCSNERQQAWRARADEIHVFGITKSPWVSIGIDPAYISLTRGLDRRLKLLELERRKVLAFIRLHALEDLQ